MEGNLKEDTIQSSISASELELEKKRLEKTLTVIKNKLSELGQDLYVKESKITEFKKFIWDNQSSFDPTEMKQVMAMNEEEVFLALQSGDYFKKLFKIQNNPYFGSIIFEENKKKELVYIGMTHVIENDFKHLVYDWRSPISSLFYDYELGPCAYDAPGGIIKGNLLRKRQYKIVDGKFTHVFDNNLNVEDELLQEVLATSSSEKMKNIVNTIQQEQNKIIRNVVDKNLIVQGIAGSGKTSVALHRVAFLLYKMKNISSSNILIFSPNQVFTEYISNVLPELGEENTMQTTFHDFLKTSIIEYKKVESFVDFVARYYQKRVVNEDLIKYKQSDEIIIHLTKYIKNMNQNIHFTKEIEVDKHSYTVSELDDMLKNRYSKLPIFSRIEEMAIKLSENNYHGKLTKKASFEKAIKDSLNISQDYKKIYGNFFKSEYSKIKLDDSQISYFINQDVLFYEDALLFVFIKGLLESFAYNSNIKQVVIDEAQDYSKLQYIIINKIFKTAGLTILGDVNQNINPYYKYESLKELMELISGDSAYLELTKTYRSSEEIIEYSNSILNLNYVSSIRRGVKTPVIRKYEKVLKEDLVMDVNYLKGKYKSIAIITKDDLIASKIYEEVKSTDHYSLISTDSKDFNKNLVIIPAYMAKGLEFDAVIIYNQIGNPFSDTEKNLYYVASTRAQHELIIYN